jgi:FMN phosphatase YigB (HAD superfamily)
VSGDVGHRKPSQNIYRYLLDAIPTVRPQSMLFVDDRLENLDAAAEHGIGTVLFGHGSSGDRAAVPDFAGLLRFVTEH